MNPNAKAGKAGTSTRRSTTGRTRGRSAGATCRSGAASRSRPTAPCSSSDAARDAISLPLARAGVSSSASIARRRCSPARGADLPNSPIHQRANSPTLSSRPRRHPGAAVRPARLRTGHRALRQSCSRCSRPRSRRRARLGRARARTGRHVRPRSRARRAELARVREPRAAAGAAPGEAPI